MPDALVRLHYLRYWQFLEKHGYIVKHVPSDPKDWEGELWSSDLTLEGYRFAQYSHDRWIGRILKFKDSAADLKYLDRWYEKFRALPRDTFAMPDA